MSPNPNEPNQHESEWIYSTKFTAVFHLSSVNDYIHSLPSVPHPVELIIFICGYSFNPVMIPAWLGLIYRLSNSAIVQFNLSHMSSPSPPDGRGAYSTKETGWIYSLSLMPPEKGAIANTAFYFVTVMMTLIFTELGKSSFATTRPVHPIKNFDGEKNTTRASAHTPSEEWTRRYGKLVSSLKSKHSFPSGDSAQAMNLSIFLWRYVSISNLFLKSVFVAGVPMSGILLFGVFVPGVAFARVFYKCHWIEDCIGGILLSSIMHWFLIPSASEKFLDLATHLFGNKL
ncbi:hypothetical protein ACHAXS_014258 [Conticribra weissflogii]